MKISTALFLLLFTCISSLSIAQSDVIVNGEPLETKTIQLLENYYRVKIQPGRYWYDRVSGWWGVEGQVPVGIMLSGLDLGGKLKSNASNGDTGIYVNGRELTQHEEMELMRITGAAVQKGRYWLHSQGWVGLEGQGAMGNIYQLAQSYYQNRQGNSFYRNSYMDTGMGGNSDGFYIIGKDFSYSQF